MVHRVVTLEEFLEVATLGSADDARRADRSRRGRRGLASLLRDPGAEELADRLDRALDAEVELIALSLDERAIMLSALEDPPQELARSGPSFWPTTSGDASEGLDPRRRDSMSVVPGASVIGGRRPSGRPGDRPLRDDLRDVADGLLRDDRSAAAANAGNAARWPRSAR